MIIIIPINTVIANKVKQLQIKQMKYKDERIKLMNEVLSGIKVSEFPYLVIDFLIFLINLIDCSNIY